MHLSGFHAPFREKIGELAQYGESVGTKTVISTYATGLKVSLTDNCRAVQPW